MNIRLLLVGKTEEHYLKQGIDDYRYAFTLRNAIERARAMGFEDEAEQANRILHRLLDDIPEPRDIILGSSYLAPGNFPAERAQACRKTIAEEIMRLNRLMDSK